MTNRDVILKCIRNERCAMRLWSYVSATLAALVSASSAVAHEFWVEPLTYQVQPGAEIKAELFVGQDFSGISYPFNDRRFDRFGIVIGGKERPVTGKIGDEPALKMAVHEDGLAVVVYQRAAEEAIYSELTKFQSFLAEKDLSEVIAQHQARGFGERRFTESFVRYAKTLIGVGSGAGADRATGLHTEIIAEANPYADAISQMPVRVLLAGKPRVNAQVMLFDKTQDGSVAVTQLRTDDEGRVQFPVEPGHAYLVDAVAAAALANNDVEAGPVWITHWASLTFAVPN
ncbi:MAG: DUF4198 domain-containing protein [Pseudomonadota bacterium]